MKSEKSWLSNREWIFVIILVILLQFLLHQYASNVMNETQVINYISFSGTIVSIILAILAIIYSFFQSITQQSNSDKIASSVESLTDVASTVNNSVDIMTEQVNSLGSFVHDVQQLPSNIVSLVSEALEKLNKEHVIDIKTIIDPLVNVKAEIEANKIKSDEDISNLSSGQNDDAESCDNIRWSTIPTTIMACMLVNKISPVGLAREISRRSEDDSNKLKELSILFTAANTIVMYLRLYGFLSENEGETPNKLNDYYYVTPSENMKEFLAKFFAITTLYYQDSYEDILNGDLEEDHAKTLISILGITERCKEVGLSEVIERACKP